MSDAVQDGGASRLARPDAGPSFAQPGGGDAEPPAPQETGRAAAVDNAADLLDLLKRQPWSLGFYQAMRRLEALYIDRPRFGRSTRPDRDPIRLSQEASVVFAPSTLAGWVPEAEGKAPRLLVHFFGLFGPEGALPLHLTEYARERRRNFRDATFERFADIFHHRALSLFYRAWADVRPTTSFDRPADDRFADYVASLIGIGMGSLRDRDAMPDLTKLHFAGHLTNQTRHAEGLASILSTFFTVPVQIECFVGTWLALAPSDRSQLGDAPETGTLGGNILLGSRVWSRQHKFRIVFGPLTLAQYLRLLPGGISFHRLTPLVRNYVGDTLIWDVNLILKAEEVPKTVLGGQSRLGWTSWIGTRRTMAPADDLHLDASADSLAQQIDNTSSFHPSEHVQ